MLPSLRIGACPRRSRNFAAVGRTQDRTWRIHPDPETGIVDADQVYGAFQEAASIVLRLGGGIVVVPERFQLASGEWVNQALNFRWTSFVPPVEPAATNGAASAHATSDEAEESEALPGIDEETLASLEGEEPFDEGDMRAADEAVAAEALEAEPVVLE